MESSLLSIMALIALVLLLAVSSGVVYLTLAGWRDRQLQEEEKRQTRLSAKATKRK